MPKFLDVHSFHSLGESKVKELQKSPPDEFGVKHLSILYNRASLICVFAFLKPLTEKQLKNTMKKLI